MGFGCQKLKWKTHKEAKNEYRLKKLKEKTKNQPKPKAANRCIQLKKSHDFGWNINNMLVLICELLVCRYLMAFLVFSVSNFSLTLLSSLITEFISREAAGSGIPEVKAYLNGVDAPGIFSLRTLVVKVTLDDWLLDLIVCLFSSVCSCI